MRTFSITREQWQVILLAIHKEIAQQGPPPRLWRIVTEANRCRRFAIEVENEGDT